MRVELFLCVLPLAAPFVLQPVTRPRVTTRRTPRAALLVPATETGAGLLAATGVLAWVAPEANLPGFKDYDSTAAAVVRTIGAWQIVLAVALLASAAEPAVAAGRTMYAAAITEMCVIPVKDAQLKCPRYVKGLMAGASLAAAALGKLTLGGAVSPLVAAAALAVVGGRVYLAPRSSIAARFDAPATDLAVSLLSLYGAVIAMSGIGLGGLALGLSRARCTALVLVAYSLVSLRWAAAEAKKLDTPKIGPLVTVAVTALLSGVALRA